ncbi:histidine ammonia-lyase HutH [Clostridium aceticum]|uniref:Histidine ammonia-lyase HutH n=1 Tax=Clostridium aceticum TaxID=84022 RepID=A0A0D8I7S1_9CLOT|nr:aromatic amino acid ammonia-lyase [Clostridium aceticum]AKL97281.1 histidine ammonia-lyase HutH [Clostridium aceticum]KJF26303.1 phenylalanine ammonia-lyase [Clostridium aceticum]
MENKSIVLDGKHLTIDEVVEIAREGVTVKIEESTMRIVEASRTLVYELANSDVPVYGFNRGVGLNKDREVVAKYYSEYNRNLILAHCVAVDPEASQEDVRAILLARLNTLLLGCTGIQPAIVTMYKDFLNHRIHPIIPERGSIGEGDITCLSHIGLAMIGEGEVYYQGVRMMAAEALEKAGLKPIVLGPKDGLAIVSSNALAAGPGAMVLKDAEDLVEMADIVYALTLEGFRGNVTPLDPKTYEVRPFPGQACSAEKVRKYLEGSYLWLPGVTESLQDPLSLRGSCQVHGSVRDALEYVKKYMDIQLNSSDDNPCVLLDEKRMISCSNYEVTTWVLGFEMLGIALSHLSRNACYRTIKLGTPKFTGLSRFLTPADTSVIAYGTIQKSFTSLDTEIRHLSNPATVDYYSLAGDIEDHANNSPFVVRKTAKILDNLYYILGMEAMHAVQAIDLRKATRLGKGTRTAYEVMRTEIPFLERDRNLSIDIKKAYNIVKSKAILKAVKEAVEDR